MRTIFECLHIFKTIDVIQHTVLIKGVKGPEHHTFAWLSSWHKRSITSCVE